MVLGVLDEPAEAHQERDQRHVGVELLRLSDPDRVPELLQLRRRLGDVVPRVGGFADPVPEVVPPDDRVGYVVVRHREVLLRLRVVGARLAERAVGADLGLDLLDDRGVVDHLVLVGGHRVDGHEQVVPALGRHLGGGAGVEESVVDVLDADLDVVLLTPGLHPGVVEPVVVGRDEVDPLDDGEVPLQPAPLVLERPGERERGGGTCRADRGCAGACLLQQLPPAEALLTHAPSFPSGMLRR